MRMDVCRQVPIVWLAYGGLFVLCLLTKSTVPACGVLWLLVARMAAFGGSGRNGVWHSVRCCRRCNGVGAQVPPVAYGIFAMGERSSFSPSWRGVAFTRYCWVRAVHG